MLLTVMLATTIETRTHQEKLYKIQGDIKEEGGKDSDEASISEKLEQVSIVEETDKNPYDVLTAQSGRKKVFRCLVT